MTSSRTRRQRARAIGSLLLVAATSAACASGTRTVSGSRSPKTGADHVRGAALAKTSLGPDGVVSSLIVAENQRPGTADWRITAQGPGTIAGFADHNYAAEGNTVGLYVTTDAPQYTVVAYRMGWYQGLGARQIWSSGPQPGKVQPPCEVTSGINMVSCDNWALSLTMPVGAEFVPGDYLLKLTGSQGQQGYVLLTIWDPTSTATYMIMNRSMVEEGWNTYGGYSFYEGKGPCTLDDHSYPPCNRARVVSFDRPFDVNGSSDYLTNEYPLVAFAEKQGLDVTYCTDICISEHPSFLLQHRALIGLDHDETWTNSERLAALDAFHAGVNMAFLGAATLVRHARLEPSPLGADRQEVDYRDASEDPLAGQGDPMDVTGNTWDQPPTNWSASSFLGQIYSGFLDVGEPNAPLVVWDASSWLFKGTNLQNGSAVPGVINSDFEHLDPAGPSQPNLQVLAHSPIPLSTAYTNQGHWNGDTYADTTYYTDPTSHAGLFDSGDNVWVGDLAPCQPAVTSCPAPVVQLMTANLLRLFGQGPAGLLEPSVPNWTGVVPKGS
jgi:N,N-dimethylformamidase beta subunit-like, C-terminal